MIKKLRNQPYAPKVGASSQMGAKRKEKNDMMNISLNASKIFSGYLKCSTCRALSYTTIDSCLK
jgi:hypothetical protein